jgi:hypothetical protein
MSDSSVSHVSLDALTGDVHAARRATWHALHVLEYALAAPAPRRHRTWLHRVTVAVEALHAALAARLPAPDGELRLLDEIALSHPEHFGQIQELRRDLRDLTIAVAALQEVIEPEPTIDVDPAEIRERLSLLTRRFRDHQAREADLVYEAIGRDIDQS